MKHNNLSEKRYSRIINELIIVVALFLAAVLAGCGQDKPGNANAKVNGSAAVSEGSSSVKEEVKPSEPEAEGNSGAGKDAEGKDGTQGKESLAKRLCGKYSYHMSSEDSEEEFYIMEVVEFGDNLYAYCGQAMADEGYECLEAYSFWASEFIPYDAEEMKSTDGDSVKVNELCFSIMSNFGKYWGEGMNGTITLTDDGLVFEGFEGEDFLCPEEDSRLFLKDERVENVFPYLKGDGVKWNTSGAFGTGTDVVSGTLRDLQGFWKKDGNSDPVFLDFLGDNLYVWQKAVDKKVFLAAGGVEVLDGSNANGSSANDSPASASSKGVSSQDASSLGDSANNGSFSGMANILGSGGMPVDWKYDYELRGNKLTLICQGDEMPGMEGEERFFRIDEADIPVITMDEVVFTADSFGGFADTVTGDANDEDGFFGIWTMAEKDYSRAVEGAKKLYDLGYDSYICYSPEWEKLNSSPFYCVTAGRYYSKAQAEEALSGLKDKGFENAYVKETGRRKYSTLQYFNYGNADISVTADKITLKNIEINFPHAWYPGFDEVDGKYHMTLVIDKDTVFDESCDTQSFGNYREGDTPLGWFQRNYTLSSEDPDEYMKEGPALSGVFEVGVNGSHIDRFFGSYWWD